MKPMICENCLKTGKVANPGVVMKSVTLNSIYVLVEWQDILKRLRRRHVLEFLCLMKLPRTSSCLLLLCLSQFWSCLLLDPQPRQHVYDHTMENWSPVSQNPKSQPCCQAVFVGVHLSGNDPTEGMLQKLRALTCERVVASLGMAGKLYCKNMSLCSCQQLGFQLIFSPLPCHVLTNDRVCRSHLPFQGPAQMSPLTGSLPVLPLNTALETLLAFCT